MFPGANATIFANEAGEPVGWDYPDDDPRPDHDWYADDLDLGFDEQVCETHCCYAGECPSACWGDNLSNDDEFCCGPHGCCSSCCGTDEDRIRGAWHEGCDIGS